MKKILLATCIVFSAAAAYGGEVPGLCNGQPCWPQGAPAFPNNPMNLLPTTPRLGVLPPPEFDRPFPAHRLFHITAAKEEMATLCPNTKTAFRITLGCTYPSPPRGVPEILKALAGNVDCIIVSPDMDLLTATGWHKYGAEIYRHEQAHCWGWPASHPGARPLPNQNY
jgi:hypothetical protein